MTAVPSSPRSAAVLADVASSKMQRAISSPRVRDALLVLAGVAVISLLAQVRIPLEPVPVTGQTLAVMLIGSAFGSRRGVIATALYVIIGLLGVPVFAGATGGISVLRGATFGYLIGFIAAAWLVGRFAEAGWDRGIKAVPAYLAAFALPYIPGLLWLAGFLASTGASVTLGAVISAGLIPFIPGEAMKIALASVLSPLAWRAVARLDRK